MDKGKRKQSRSKTALRYIAIFLVSVVLTLVSLIYGTVAETLDEVWREEGRVYDTKWESFISGITGKTILNRVRKGNNNLDSWPLAMLEKINRYQYEQAIKKIPNDDFERVWWYYWAVFLPRYQGNLEQLKKYADGVLPIVTKHIVEAPKYRRASAIINDVYYPLIIRDYSEYFFDVAPEVASNSYEKNRLPVLRVLFQSASELDPEKVVRQQANDTVVKVLTNAYPILANNIFYKGNCNLEIANKWLAVSDKVYRILLQDTKAAEIYLTDEDIRYRYNFLARDYREDDKRLRDIIKRKC